MVTGWRACTWVGIQRVKVRPVGTNHVNLLYEVFFNFGINYMQHIHVYVANVITTRGVVWQDTSLKITLALVLFYFINKK